MRTKIFKTFVVACAVLSAVSVKAQAYLQDPRYGNTPEERKANVITLNSFNDYYTTKDYDHALRQLHVLVANSPKASINVYIKGAAMYKTKIMAAKSVAEKKSYIDSLMWVYDLRIEHFADYRSKSGVEMGAGYTSQLKARDYLQFNPADKPSVLKFFKNAMELENYNVAADFGLLYFNELVEEYKNDELEADYVLSEYAKLENTINAASQEDKDTFDALFASSGVANCDSLEAMFKPKFEENPADSALVSKAYALMSKADCKSDLYIAIAEKYYAIAPSSTTAIRLAAMCENKKDFAKALKYLNESLETETDPVEKSNLYVRVAASELGAGRAAAAASAARSAVSLNPESGYGYMMLAQAYAVGASSYSGIQGQSAYWLVVDVLSKARTILADDPVQTASIDSQIGRYRAYFPSTEECFFNGLSEGATYNVSCGWISGTTTVRPRK